MLGGLGSGGSRWAARGPTRGRRGCLHLLGAVLSTCVALGALSWEGGAPVVGAGLAGEDGLEEGWPVGRPGVRGRGRGPGGVVPGSRLWPEPPEHVTVPQAIDATRAGSCLCGSLCASCPQNSTWRTVGPQETTRGLTGTIGCPPGLLLLALRPSVLTHPRPHGSAACTRVEMEVNLGGAPLEPSPRVSGAAGDPADHATADKQGEGACPHPARHPSAPFQTPGPSLRLCPGRSPLAINFLISIAFPITGNRRQAVPGFRRVTEAGSPWGRR